MVWHIQKTNVWFIFTFSIECPSTRHFVKTTTCRLVTLRVHIVYDNDNDNETMFIAKWHTVHVQRTYVKNRSSRTNIHEIYKTWQRGLEAIVAYVPQYQLYKADCFGSAEQRQCRVLEVFQYKTLSFMHMYIHIYTSYGTHMPLHIHVYTSIHRESIITVDASMH